MTKKSRRRPSRNNRDQGGCMSGLISIFDFRQGRSTRKLLADKKRVNKQVINVSGGQSNIQTIISRHAENSDRVEGVEENKVSASDIAKTSVKKLMEEEMINEQGYTNLITDFDSSLEQENNSKQGNYSKKNIGRRKNRARSKSNDMDMSGHEQRHSNILDLAKLVQELAQVDHINIQAKRGINTLDTSCYNASPVVQDKLIASVKDLLEQKMSENKYFGEESSEYMDALEMLSSNKGLFLKQLQDPNSTLVKHIENLEDAQLGKDQVPSSLLGSNLHDQSANLKSDENRKHHNIFRRRRSKSLGSYPLELVKDDSQSPNRIVVLKPGPAESDSSETDTTANNKVSSRLLDVDSKVLTRHTSQFSFTEIKRKLRHAMGKDLSPGTSPAKKVSPGHKSANHAERANLGWKSPNRNHFYTERFTLSSPLFGKRSEQVGQSKENGFVNVNETSQYPRLDGSSIYIEAKKHLSEMLKSGDENGGSVDVQLPKPLGRILSIPDHNSSPCCSPRKQVEDVSINAQMRLAHHDMLKKSVRAIMHESDDNCPSPSRDDLESKQRTDSGNFDDDVQCLKINVEIQGKDDRDCSLETQSSAEDITIHEEIEDATETKTQEEENIDSISCESSNYSITDEISNGDTNEEIALTCSEESSQCLKSDLSKEDQCLSSPTMSPAPYSPFTRDIEDSDYAVEKIDRPSPISILEPLFADDEISSQSINLRSVEKDIEPRHIHFEVQYPPIDQVICTSISLEDEESAFEYVEAVLLGSGLNWDEFSLRWLSHDEILDPSLFDEVELFSNRSHHDQKLLFDCANEALEDICQIYFRCFTGVSCLKQSNQQVPRGMDLINDVWCRIEALLISNPQPLSLDQHISRDLTRSRKWMDLRPDAELIGNEMEDIIFDELLEDTVLSFEDDDSSMFEKSES